MSVRKIAAKKGEDALGKPIDSVTLKDYYLTLNRTSGT